MLDNRAFKILDIAIGMTTEGESAVIEKTEILTQLGETVDFADLDKIMETLALNDMISLIYTDDKVYCITPRPKGRIAYEKRQQAAAQNAAAAVEQPAVMAITDAIDENGVEIPVRLNIKKLAAICAVSSFLGGFFAAIFAFIIARLF